MKRLNLSLFAAATGLMMLVACKPSPERISVSPENLQLTDKSATAEVRGEAVDKNGARVEGVTVTWSSSDENVAKVDASGMVSAVGSGVANIKASADKLSAEVPVTVSLPAKINVDKSQLTLTPETTSDTVAATIMTEKDTPWAGAGKVTWSSADQAIATVDESGKVTGVAPGSTTISASFNDLKIDVAVTSSVPAAAPAAATADAAAAAPAPAAPTQQ